MKKHAGLLLSSVVVFSLLLSGCGSEQPAATDAGQAAPAASEAAAGGEVINIEATNWKFNQDTYEVKAGTPVTIHFSSKEGYHGIIIDGLGVEIQKEGSKTITPEPGEYKILCSIPCGPDHGQMVATLVVK